MPVSRIKLSQASSSPEFSRLVFGAWRLLDRTETSSPQAIAERIETAIEAGITTFDHADIYGNYAVEEAFGRALKLNPNLKNRIEIVTKTGIKLLSPARPNHRIKSYDTSKAYITQAVENSLKALGVASIDLLLLHRPDLLMDPEEISATFTELAKAGKCRSFGVSNYSASQFEMLQSRMSVPLVTNQIELNPFQMSALDNGVMDLCMQRKVSPMAWSPLGGGKLFDGNNPNAVRVSKTMHEILDRRSSLPRGATIEHVCYAWLLAHPANIVPVLGTANLDRIRNASIAEHIQLTREEWYEIWQASKGHEVA
jgi:predicted oxidoreductase